jgi:4-amino-4-deoxy-L-arabinose transferase-like glycosyltransferase
LVLWAFLLRVACALVLHLTGYSRLLAPDEQTYAEDGWAIALYWLGETFAKPWRYSTSQPIGYFQLNGAFFALFGQTELPIKIATAAIGALTVRYVYFIGRRLFGVSVARRSALLATGLPSLVLWSSVNIRDAWVILLLVFAAWQGLRLQEKASLRGALLYVVAVVLVSRFRDYLVYILLIAPVVALLTGRRKNVVRGFALGITMSVIGLVLLQQGVVGETTESRLSLEAIAAMRQNMATGSSAFERSADVSTVDGAVRFLPIGLTYFFFSPFPWQITSILKALALPEMLFLYYMAPSLWRGMRFAATKRLQESIQILLLITLIACSYALGSGNVGTMYRHRAQAMVFLLVFAALGYELGLRRGPLTERGAPPRSGAS